MHVDSKKLSKFYTAIYSISKCQIQCACCEWRTEDGQTSGQQEEIGEPGGRGERGDMSIGKGWKTLHGACCLIQQLKSIVYSVNIKSSTEQIFFFFLVVHLSLATRHEPIRARITVSPQVALIETRNHHGFL